MPKEKLPPLPVITVVHIGRGDTKEASVAYSTMPGYDSSLYWGSALRLDGRPNEARGRSGALADGRGVTLSHYAVYDAEREAKASPLRARIKELYDQAHKTETELLELYRP